MSENAKTLTFVVIGLVAVVLGLVTRPKAAVLDTRTLIGTDLTKAFNSGDDAKRLRIVGFDEDTATLRDFEVSEKDGLWSIPSKDGYPADAARQMGEAATSLMDRKILEVASSNAGEHEQYGVIDPTSPKLEPGQKGVGTRVTMYNEKQEPLVDLIIGKAVKGAEGQRYVREAGRNFVYIIEIDRSKLSTNFEDWIEKDLLKLNAWDLAQVDVKDYSAQLVQDGQSIGIVRDDRADLTFDYDDQEGKWAPVKMQSYDRSKGPNGEFVDFKLADDEELNKESLNGLKTALDDLQIVDVVRKPAGLSDDLKAGAEFVKDKKSFLDLATKGFTATGIDPNAPQDIISSYGEVIATMKNGVEYVLRFGNLTNVAAGEKSDPGAAEAGAAKNAASADAEKKKGDNDVHRYMFVMARYNDQAVKRPQLKPLPELPAADAPKPADAAAAPPADGTPATPPAEAPKTDAPKTDEAKPAEAAAADAKAAEAKPAEAKAEEPKADAAKTDAPKTDTPKAEDAAKPAEPGAPADPAKKPDVPAAAAADKDKELARIMAERKLIEQENQRMNDEYQANAKKANEAVKELNLRFGDWYFVVDDNVFQKIRLGKKDVVKKKEPPKAAGPGAPGAAPGTSNPFPAGGPPVGLPEIPANKQ